MRERGRHRQTAGSSSTSGGLGGHLGALEHDLAAFRVDQDGVAVVKVALEQARATAANEMEQIRRQSEAELTARQAEVERKVGELQDREAALYAAEQNFKGEIDALRTEVAEKRFLLENRNEQLLQVKMEADELQDRIIQLESAVRQLQGESLNRSERTGEYTRTALDSLWEKEERQAAANDLEQGFRAEISRYPGAG